MGQFIDSLKVVKQNYSKYDVWEQTQADERAKKEYLAKNTGLPQDKVELTSKKAQAVIRATEIMDKYSEDNCEDMEQATGLIAAVPIATAPLVAQLGTPYIQKNKVKKLQDKILALKADSSDTLLTPEVKTQIDILQKRIANINTRYPFYGLAANLLIGIGLFASFSLWGNSKQKEASRIGRYQARQNELKDVRNFVIYTPEQIKQAEEKAKKLPDEKEKNSILKMINELKAMHKDKKAYRQWLKSKDPDAIDKLKKLNLSPEQLQTAKENQELIVDAVKEINIKAEEYSENVENAFDTLGAISWVLAVPIGWTINSLLRAAKVSGGVRAVASFAIPILTSLGISMTGAFAEKEASRVGRYVARKGLSSNPARLMAYSDEDMKKAANVKAPKQNKSLTEKISNSFSFLYQYMKDSKEYKKYKKTGYQQQEKLHKAFADIKITDAQKKEAENLQKNVFTAFDEIDEMSQRYSEDVEAGSEIAKNIIGQFWGLGVGLAGILSTIAIIKGKFPFSKIVNTVANLGFKKDSTLKIAINDFYKELKKDKKLMHNLHLSLIEGTFNEFMLSSRAQAILPAYKKLLMELAGLLKPEMFKNPDTFIKIWANLGKNDGAEEISKLLKAEMEQNPEMFKNILSSHLKQGAFAKWARNFLMQGGELFVRSKFDMPLGDISNYKTLAGTGAVFGIPILGVIFSIPYVVNAWFTNVQKKAGKIGIMKAMEKIDDPRVFADTNS